MNDIVATKDQNGTTFVAISDAGKRWMQDYIGRIVYIYSSASIADRFRDDAISAGLTVNVVEST